MYIAEPLTVLGAAPPLRLCLVQWREFTDAKPFGEEDVDYFDDLLRSYGMPGPGELYRGGHVGFRDMVEGLLPQLGGWGDRFDLAVLAHSTPDSEVGWPICYLMDSVAEPGLAFSISDQGPTVPFTALRLVTGSARTHHATRAQLWITDQCAVLHDQPLPARLRPTRNAAVALVFDRAGGYELVDVRQLTDVPADRVPQLLMAAAHRGGTRSAAVTAVWGAGLAPEMVAEIPVALQERAPAGLPCTGVWIAVSRLLGDGGYAPGPILVADYDEDLRYLGICVLERAAGPAGSSA